jgi:hypothetical protein
VNQGRLTRQLSPDVAAYIAGLIDGEGTVTLTRLHANENRRVVVSIANTEIQLLRFVIDQVGAGKITRKKTSSERHTPSVCYTITSRQALALLRQITPHLRSYKRQRAELLLARYEALTPRNGKYSRNQLSVRRAFEEALLALRARG